MNKKIIILIIVIIISGCGQKKPPEPPPQAVIVDRPIRQSVRDHLELTGNIQALNSVQLVARVAGYLDRVPAVDGATVKKGQLLFVIQQDTYVSRLNETEGQVAAQKALLRYAEVQFRRYKELFARQAASKADFDNWRYQRRSASANLKIARASRDLAKLDLDYTEVRAPFDGRIDRRFVDIGNLVGAGENTVLSQLTQIDPLNIYFTISDKDFARLSQHTKDWKLSVGLIGENGYPHEGYIDFTSPTVSTTTGTLLLRGVLPNPSQDILPGSYARVLVPMEEINALLLPEEAVSSDMIGSYILIVDENNTVQRRNVKTGFLVGRNRVISEGLKGDEIVIVKGMVKTAPGRKVTPTIQGSAA